ncbi:MAG: HAD hydrolase-like protein [Bacteroidota bacterium]|nr:HAD hydrolase-like protein [Bacteroidota bacterium]MDP4235839.1 HAD hydrolase-like protein [Bacteroidota bacterium]
MKNRHTLILWDIDGTLVIYKDKFPHRLFEGMIKEFFGQEISLKNYRFSGKTDKAIIADMIGIAGIPAEVHREKEEAMMEWVADKVEADTSPDSFNLLPNVTELLKKLAAEENTTQALLTGNLPRCAEIKLQHFDLMKYFAFGAYGIESINRNDLGPIALEKFARHHNGNTPEEFDPVVIGDTIPDILCAKHIRAKSIITLTGRTVREEVEPYGPDYILNDLSDTDKVLQAIYS